MDKETLKNLLYKNESVADLAPETMAQADAFCEGYKKFLDNGKTEREACAYSEGLLKAAGYRPFVPGGARRPGDMTMPVGKWLAGETCTMLARLFLRRSVCIPSESMGM